MTVGKKLFLCLSATLASALLLGIYSLVAIGSVESVTNDLIGNQGKKMRVVSVIDSGGERLSAANRGLILASFAKNQAQVDDAKEEFRASKNAIEKAINEIRPLLQTEEGRQIVDAVQSRVAAWAPVFEEEARLCAAGQTDAALQLRNERAMPLAKEIEQSTSRLYELTQGLMVSLGNDADATVARSRWIIIGLLLLSFGAGATAIMTLRRTMRGLHGLALEMAESAEQVASASTQIASSSQSLAQGASEQAASLEETSASTEEITAMIQRNAENSKASAVHVLESAKQVEEANRVLKDMVASMEGINASSDKVAKIIKVIDEIAFQTNILALNAAVEAARAGEAGMGFAVVADEVRNLAQRSAQAAKDTTALIEESITRSREGSGKLDQVAGVIRAITESSGKVKSLVDEVKQGSEEQARGIQQIAKAITQMEQVTQKSAANAEESASAGQEMSSQSGVLRGAVKRLQAIVGADDTGAVSTSQAATSKTTARAAKAPVTRSPVRTLYPPAAVATAKPGPEAFPLDGDFKEF